jgi:hypothetical protein
MKHIGGDIPVIQNNNCDNCYVKRNKYLEKCVPLYNIIDSQLNLGFVENNETYAIYHSSSNSENYTINQSNGDIISSNMPIPSDESFDDKKSTYLDKIKQFRNI